VQVNGLKLTGVKLDASTVPGTYLVRAFGLQVLLTGLVLINMCCWNALTTELSNAIACLSDDAAASPHVRCVC